MPPLQPSPAVTSNHFTIQSSQVSTTASTSYNANLLAVASTSSTSHSGTPMGQQINAMASQNVADDHSGNGQVPDPNTEPATPVQGANAMNVQITVNLPGDNLLKFDRPLRLPFLINDSESANQADRAIRLPLPVNTSVSANLPLPPNWNENMESAYQSFDPYKLVPVDSTTHEYRKLTELLGRLPISGIHQIVNPTVWTRFVNARNEMLKAKCNDPMVLKELGLNDQEIARKQQSLNFFRHNAVDGAPFDDNFALLFHCTKDPANVELILRDGFDERMSRGGILGKGIYFSDKPRKSIAYDRCDGVMFICGVLLGDCFRYKDLVSRDVCSLVKGPQKLPAERRYIDDYYFDSVSGNFKFNEYAVYNRYQCYPFYKVTYSIIGSKYTGHFSECRNPPPFGWLAENESHNLAGNAHNSTWALHAKTVFGEMEGIIYQPPFLQLGNEKITQHSLEKLEKLKYLGHTDSELNLKILQQNNYHFGRTVDALLRRNIGEVLEVLKVQQGEIAANKNKSENSSTVDDIPKKRQMLNVSTEPDKKPLVSHDPTEEFCYLCCNLYSKTPSNCMKLLQCEHKLCAECYVRVEITRETMSGVSHTSIKCPFCQLTAGIAIGICPCGEMSESIVPSHCAGYEDCGTILLIYEVNAPMDASAGLYSSSRSSDARTNSSAVSRRRAFLPNNPEGQSILKLLRIAWDRRMIFTIGTSHTTGRDNSLVWNIHHKTSQTGGAHRHGYPDAAYLERVRAELKGFGIE